jgi:hypothetical protein
MASLQPVTQSYVEEPKSCFTKPVVKPYNKGSVMDVLVRESPLMAYIAQVARLDYNLDDMYFKGTCFAPCQEYCSRYWNTFKGKMDPLTARRIILSSCLEVEMKEQHLYAEASVFPTLDTESLIYISEDGKLNNRLIITKADQQCLNGIIHFTNGLIDPNFC